MEQTGLRHRVTGGEKPLPVLPQQSIDGANEPVVETTRSLDDSGSFEGSIAAAFLSSKGTELLQFAKLKVEENCIKTRLVTAEDKEHNVLIMTLPFEQMLDTAEELALRKRDLEGHVRSFSRSEISKFTSSPAPQGLFSQSEQILLLEYCLDKIKPDSNFDDVIGNESILEWCKRQNYLDDVFPLHHRPSADAIMKELSISSPFYDVDGISKLQNYFGEKVALYFAFLTFYTKALFTYGFAGLTVTILSQFVQGTEALFLFAYSIFATLWGASLTSVWKGRNIEIVYMWTSLIMGDSTDESLMSMTKKEDLRNKFFGVEVSHHITGEQIVVFPRHLKLVRFFLSTVVVLASLVVSSKVMMAALDFEDIMNVWIEEKAHLQKWSSSFVMKSIVLKNLPMVVYLGCLNILDAIYSIIARKLTDHENHKYHSEYENSLVLKLVLFQFLNMNAAYLYVAFVRRDYIRLATSIRTVLLLELIIGNIKETIIPIFLARRKRKAKMAEALKKKREENPNLEESECFVVPADLDPISTQLEMKPYDGVFEDYFELVRQFSQITLFAAAFPQGAALAAFNNVIEIYTDSYKLVNMTRRASPRRALDIGAWIHAFEFISIISVMTNLGIITVTANYADAVVGKEVSKTEEYFWMIVIEHLLIVARFGFMAIYEGVPSWVRDHRAKERFLASKKPPSVDSNVTDNED
eukprot:GFKZ01008517.1.p1 GENE.GFKZ01008517.1~~GFKZ01008517.1.p1  ORF type:complete len:696 (-),score=114.22 GFKZ01008517.1:661-2748(-)